MELLKLSKFKLQLGSLISALQQSREKERYASDQFRLLLQKQKETEEIYNGKLKELQDELATSYDLRRKLETKLNYLQNDNELLDNKQKELQGTISRLLQSRESFVKVYEDSTFEMKQAITHKDKTISGLTEKINLHMSLVSSIEKEALSVKQIVDNAQQVLSEKEEVVAALKIKVDRATTLGTEFMDKITKLDAKLKSNEDELRRKDKIILDLESQLEAAHISDKGPAAEEELKETLLAKGTIIQSLISEKKALHFELSSLQIIITKIQDFIRHMDEESKKAFSSVMASQECVADTVEEKNRSEYAVKNTKENFPQLSDVSLPQSNCFLRESTVNIINMSFAEAEDNCRISVNQLDSECSTTQPQTS